MHQTIEAVYNNGQFTLTENPNIKKARVLITFLNEINDDTERMEKIKFPTRELGEIKSCDREELYGDYLSDRH